VKVSDPGARQSMNSKFTHPLYEILIVLLLVGHLTWNISMVIHLGNPMAIVPAVIQLVVFYFLFIKSQYLSYWIKLWAIYLFVSGGISFVSKVLLGISRSTYPEGIEWKMAIILTGVLLWWIASKKVVVYKAHEVDDQ